MATEEHKINGNEDTSPPASPAAPMTLPPYPEMILAAIDALNDENGSNKSSISRQIEATYGNLPPAHNTLLTHHLNRMKATGQLSLVKNNYLRPDPNAPPRRGRGRPPKPKPTLPPGTVLPPPRPRGRPPKPRDPFSPSPPPKSAPSPSGSGRKRGRPPKVKPDMANSGVSQSPKAAKTAPTQSPAGTPRGRGRPPKVKPAVLAPVGA